MLSVSAYWGLTIGVLTLVPDPATSTWALYTSFTPAVVWSAR
jgi:hypothetical protein